MRLNWMKLEWNASCLFLLQSNQLPQACKATGTIIQHISFFYIVKWFLWENCDDQFFLSVILFVCKIQEHIHHCYVISDNYVIWMKLEFYSLIKYTCPFSHVHSIYSPILRTLTLQCVFLKHLYEEWSSLFFRTVKWCPVNMLRCGISRS